MSRSGDTQANIIEDLVDISRTLGGRMASFRFSEPVAFTYHPLQYAWQPHEQYLRRFGAGTGRTVLVGMNPGPFGMAQTGVPFGDVSMVRDWLGIEGPVGKPESEHPKRVIHGFGLTRREVSGSRLWGWAQAKFGEPAAFFSRFFVLNYCPSLFLHATGRNLTPDKVPGQVRHEMQSVCDDALRRALDLLQPSYVVGVGAWAEKRARACAGDRPVGRILHPSPASPAANRGWAAQADAQFLAMGIATEP